MDNQFPPEVLSSLKRKGEELQTSKRTLEINPPALERLVSYSMDALSLLLYESDSIARARRGDDIQSGDVELAIRKLRGRNKGSFWFIAVGSAFAGAGAQGLVDAILSGKGISFITVYAVAVIL